MNKIKLISVLAVVIIIVSSCQYNVNDYKEPIPKDNKNIRDEEELDNNIDINNNNQIKV